MIDLSTDAARADTVKRLKARAEEQRAQAQAWLLRERQAKRNVPAGGPPAEGLVGLDSLGRPIYLTTENSNAAISTAVTGIRNVAPYQLNGAGWTVGVWDGGAVLGTHQEFGARVSIMDGSSKSDHATHVAGTIGAAGVSPSAMGMAPMVNIASYDWGSDTSEMTGVAATASGQAGKITVSNHSYGLISGWYGNFWVGNWGEMEDRSFGQYSDRAREWDAVSLAAPYYLIFKSAGNDRDDPPPAAGAPFSYYGGSGSYNPAIHPPGDGAANGGYDTISDRGIAKNIVTVGAVDDAVSGGLRAPAAATMSGFSGWGPADDGRIKPDLVANGVGLYSPLDSSNTAYGSYSGTSMASPNASGSAILLQEYHADLNGGLWMRAATLKGLLIHTADDLGNAGPDYQFGWGLINSKAAADVIAADAAMPANGHLTEDSLATADSSDSFTITASGSAPLRITLSWTDPSGAARTGLDDPTPALVNDLDVRVTGPGGTRSPFVLNPSAPADAATTGDNVRDNVEQILIPSPAAGDHVVTVTHKGALAGGAQAYSLIVTGQGAAGGSAVLSVADATVTENDGHALVGITLSQSATSDVAVNYQTVAGSALAGSDFTAISGSFTIPAGQTTASLAVPIIDDGVGEVSETFQLQVTSATGATIGDASGTVTILDNDQGRFLRVAVFDDPAYVDTAGGSEAESDNLQAALLGLGYQVATFTGTSASAWQGAFANADVVVVPELENGDLGAALGTDARQVIADRVTAGKGLLLFPDYTSFSRLASFSNATLGWSLASAGSYHEGQPISREAGLPAGFGSLPSSLAALNGSVLFQRGSLPADSRVLYSLPADSSKVAAFKKGTAYCLSWDWYDPSQTGAALWQQALGRCVEAAGGGGSTIPARLAATEFFPGSGDAVDLTGKSVTLTPDGAGGYTYRTTPITALPFDPSSGSLLASISSADDAFQQVSFAPGESFPFFGVAETSVFVSSNGVLSFGQGYTAYAENLADHLARRQIAVLWDDLLPSSSGDVRSLALSDRLVVSYDQVAEFSDDSPNVFQAELFHDGRIRLSWLQVSLEDAVVGISPGGLGHLAASHQEEDFASDAPLVPVIGASPATLAASHDPAEIDLQIASNSLWTWSIDQPWVLSAELPVQGGDQTFSYVLPANLAATPRTATLTFSSDGETVVHQVTQAGAPAGTYATTLVQTLGDGSQSLWMGTGTARLNEAWLTAPAGSLTDAFDGAGQTSVQTRPEVGTLTATNAWTNRAITPQTGTFTASFVTVPGGNAVDSVVGFSNGAADNWNDLAAYVRFYTDGEVDARNGGNFNAVNLLEYTAGVAYLVEMTIDVTARRYWATVTPAGGSPVVIASNYAFRSEQASVTQLTNFACLTWTGGSQTVTNLVTPSTAVNLPPLVTSDVSGPLAATVAGGGVTVAKSVSLVPDRHATDDLVTLTNTGSQARHVTLSLADNLGSDGATVVHGTSSGDTVVGPDDTWFVSSDHPVATEAGNDPALMISWLFPSSVPAPAMSFTPGGGDDQLAFAFAWTLAAGQSVSFVIRRELFDTAAQALGQGLPLSNLVTTLADSGHGSLRQVTAAATEGSVVRFDPSLSGQTILLTSGQIVIDKDLVIDASSLPGGITVSAGETSRAFEVFAGVRVEMTGLTVTRGLADSGGAIRNGGWLEMADCRLIDNTATEEGGAIHNEGRLDLNDCEFSNNRCAGGLGGAICNEESAEGTWTGTRLLSNTATAGGAVFNRYSVVLTLRQCRLAGNDATTGEGGAFYHAGDTLLVEDSDLSANRAGHGGAIINNGPLILNRCTLAWNFATGSAGGGAIHNNSDGHATLSNCTVAENRSGGDGGGIRNLDDGVVVLVSSTISRNQADSEGGGISNENLLSLANSIVAGNASGIAASDIGGPVTSQSGQNLVSHIGTMTGYSGLVGEPMLTPLGIHGGPTPTMPPLAGSPAIHQAGATSLTTDQRGFPRVLGGAADLGAVESGHAIPTLVVNTAEDQDDGIGVNGISLRDAVKAAAPGATITFDPALSGVPLTLASGEIPIDRNLTITGGTSAIGLDSYGSSRIFQVAPGVHAVIENLDVADGYGFEEGGGGILNDGLLVIRGCSIGGCFAEGDGGGIRNRLALVLEQSTVAWCGSDGEGGGIASTGLLELRASTIRENQAYGGNGGGIIADGSTRILRSTLAGNTCNGVGGAVHSPGRFELLDSTASGNSAIAAAGISCPDELLVIGNSIVAANEAEEGEPADIAAGWIDQKGVNLVSDATGLAGFTGIVASPQLSDPGDHGGTTPTMLPLSGSPAINAGTSYFSSLDQRGLARPVGAAVDIGAVEVQPPVPPTLVTNTANSGAGSLRQAVATAPPGSPIHFASHLDGATIALTGGQITFASSVTIDASSLPAGITVSAGGASRIFEVQAGVTASITGLAITGGSVPVSGSNGGGIANQGTLTLIRCTVSNCTARNGGGIDNNGTLALVECTIRNNTTPSFNGAGIDSSGPLTATACTFTENSAGSSLGGGGAIQHTAGPLTLVSCTFSGNTAAYGGAIDGDNDSVLELTHCTISGNTAALKGGGIEEGDAGTLILRNCILAGNICQTSGALDDRGGPDLFGSPDDWPGTDSQGINLIGSLERVGGTFEGIVGAPVLMPLGNHGGVTLTRPPQPGSPALDAGEILPVAVDQRGAPRLAGSGPDLGSVEVQVTPLVVLNPDDSGPGSLRDTIALATSGAEITVDPTLSGQTITLTGGPIGIDKELDVDSSALPEGLVISAGGQSRIFEIEPQAELELAGLTLTGGKAEEPDGRGGAILNHGYLKLVGCIIHDNLAVFDGGGIHNTGFLDIFSSTFSKNLAPGGGGGAISSDGDASVDRSTVYGNGAGGEGGGAIKMNGSSVLAIYHSTLTGNSSNDNGGAIYFEGTLDMASCTVVGNTGVGTGGIHSQGGYLQLSRSIVAGNHAYEDEPSDISGEIDEEGAPSLLGTPGIAGHTGPVGSPNLSPLGLHGGPTLTMPPLTGSPAIDAGGPGSGTDQRGLARQVGPASDIGAVESGNAHPTVIVTTASDEDHGGLTGVISLREAMRYASPGSRIRFAPALGGSFLVVGDGLLAARNHVVDGTGVSGGITWVGNGDGSVLRVRVATAAAIEGIVITGGGSALGPDGGGIRNDGWLHLAGCTIRDCVAETGGGISTSGELSLTGCSILDNSAFTSAGGIHLKAGEMRMEDSTVAGNSIYEGSGAGLLVATSTRAEIGSSTFSGNVAGEGHGGAIANDGYLELTSSTLAGNYTKCMGGGLDNDGYASLVSCTVAVNECDDGSILYSHDDGGGGGINNFNGTLVMEHTIVAGNTDASGYAPDLRGAVSQPGQNLLGNLVGSAGFTGMVADPLLGPLADNGGPTRTMLLLTGSPAIDAAGESLLATDQRGLPRTGGAGADLGATEVQGAVLLTVTNANDSGPGSLRDVVASAPAGATIGFDPSLDDQTIVLTSDHIALDKDLVIDATDRHGLAVSAEGESAIFNVTTGDTVVIRHLEIRDGTAGNGGLVGNAGHLTMEHCRLSGGSSLEGGALSNAPGAIAVMSDCAFTGSIGGYGGAAYNEGTMTVHRAMFLFNEAEDQGGALYNTGHLTVNDSTFHRNGALSFGGAVASSGTLVMSRCLIEKCSAADNGGGLDLTGTATLDACSISGNTSSGSGGGIAHFSGSLTLTNGTIAGNEALADYGGGIHTAGVTSVISCTIAGNDAVIEGGGIHVASGGQLTLQNSIVANNTAPDNGPDLRGAISVQSGVNLLSTTAGVTGGFAGIVADPSLLPLGLHGGPTLTMPPATGSPAINAGGASALTVDQRGLPRVAGGALDIGAVETGNALPTITVTTTADETDGIGAGGISLRDALGGAEPGSVIAFAAGLDAQTIPLTAGPLEFDKNLIVDASALPGGITITGAAGPRCFFVPAGRHALISGLTVSGFNTDDDGAAACNEGGLVMKDCLLADNNAADGGAIANRGDLLIEECILDDNECWSDGGGLHNTGFARLVACKLHSNGTSNAGAGIYNAGSGSLEVTDSVISAGFANTVGGGLYNAGTASFSRATFTGNVSESGSGGGIQNLGSLELVNSTLTGNVVWLDGGGGAISNSGDLEVISCTIAGNQVEGFGGSAGISNFGSGEVLLSNSIVANNRDDLGIFDFEGAIQSQTGVNLVSSTQGISGGFSGIVADPRLAPLGDYDGLTPVMPPLPGSPVIEAAVTNVQTPSSDQLGRPRPNGPLPDIGAVEAVAFATLGLADTDGDGIPDLLESAYGLTVGTNDSGVDGDGDGSSDAEEIGNMTDPGDPGDLLRILTFERAAGFDPQTNPRFIATFPSFPGLSYSVEADLDLDFAGPDRVVVIPPFLATGHEVEVEVPLRPGKDFIRVRRE